MDCSPLASPNQSNNSQWANQPHALEDEEAYFREYCEQYGSELALNEPEPKESSFSTTIRTKKDNDSYYQERFPIYEQEGESSEYDMLYEECGYDYEPNKMSEEKKSSPVVISIRGIDIMFPYEPYEPQRVYMEKGNK